MAVLSKIRQRSLLLILVIGFCLLAFIIGDIFSSGGFNSVSKYVGSVNGKDITFEDFATKVNDIEKSGQGITITQAANRVWDQEIAIALLTEEFDKLGLRSSEKHMIEALRTARHTGQNPVSVDEAGMLDSAKYKTRPGQNPGQASIPKSREKQAELSAKLKIYNTMIRAGLYTTE